MWFPGWSRSTSASVVSVPDTGSRAMKPSRTATASPPLARGTTVPTGCPVSQLLSDPSAAIWCTRLSGMSTQYSDWSRASQTGPSPSVHTGACTRVGCVVMPDPSPRSQPRERVFEDREPLVEQLLGDDQRRQEPQHVPEGPAREHDQPGLVARLRDLARERGIRLQGARLDQLDGDHRAAPAHVADLWMSLGELAQPGKHDVADPARHGGQVLLAHGLDRAERGGAGDRVSAERAAEATGVHRIHHLGAAGHAG